MATLLHPGRQRIVNGLAGGASVLIQTLLVCRYPDDRKHRSEHLLLRDPHGRRHLGFVILNPGHSLRWISGGNLRSDRQGR